MNIKKNIYCKSLNKKRINAKCLNKNWIYLFNNWKIIKINIELYYFFINLLISNIIYIAIINNSDCFITINQIIAVIIIIASLALWRYYGGTPAEPSIQNGKNKV